MSLPELDTAGRTDLGLKRHRNEDTFKILVPPANAPQFKLGALFMVADGMGGVRGGEVASRSTVEEIIREFYGPPQQDVQVSDENPISLLQNSIQAANDYVREQAVKLGLDYIGSTLAGLLLLSDQEAVVFNVGDSRVYRVRERLVELLTHDQSVSASRTESPSSYDEPTLRRSSTITAFVGQAFPLTPFMQPVAVQSHDVFLLCTDGLWSLIESDEIISVVHKTSANRIVDRLIDIARERGAPDNVTAVVVRLAKRPRSSVWPRFLKLG